MKNPGEMAEMLEKLAKDEGYEYVILIADAEKITSRLDMRYDLFFLFVAKIVAQKPELREKLIQFVDNEIGVTEETAISDDGSAAMKQ